MLSLSASSSAWNFEWSRSKDTALGAKHSCGGSRMTKNGGDHANSLGVESGYILEESIFSFV